MGLTVMNGVYVGDVDHIRIEQDSIGSIHWSKLAPDFE
jgi:hypothetical protein